MVKWSKTVQLEDRELNKWNQFPAEVNRFMGYWIYYACMTHLGIPVWFRVKYSRFFSMHDYPIALRFGQLFGGHWCALLVFIRTCTKQKILSLHNISGKYVLFNLQRVMCSPLHYVTV